MSVATLGIWVMACAASVPTLQQAPQLEPLGHYVGEWKFDGNLNGNPFLKGTAESKFILDGSFLQQHLDLRSPNGDDILKLMFLRTWDAKRQQYRSWSFAPGGDSLEWTGSWDADSRTMSWKAERDQDSYTLTSEFKTGGQEAWSLITLDEFGQQKFAATGTNVRTTKD